MARSRFWNFVCGFHTIVYYLFGTSCVLFLLMLFSLYFIEPDSPSVTIIYVNLVLISANIVVSIVILYKCDEY